MSLRLNDPVDKIPLVGKSYKAKLEKLGIETVSDLLFHVPSRYEDYRFTADLANLKPGSSVTVQGRVEWGRNQYSKSGKKIQLVKISNNKGSILAVWFNQPYLIKNFPKNQTVSLSGKVDFFGKNLALIAPQHESYKPQKGLVHTGRLVPIYSETAGLSSKWLRSRLSYLLEQKLDLDDVLPQDLVKKYKLLSLNEVFSNIHFPTSMSDIQRARERLAFEELLIIHLKNLLKKQKESLRQATQISINKAEINQFLTNFGFKLTPSQKQAVFEILSDLRQKTPMNRLLQGDVGTGKTAVAAVAAFATSSAGEKVVLMAPTQILAQQHFHNFQTYFKNYDISVGIVTGNTKTSKSADILIGTHALLHKKNLNPTLVIIDEQHRFGVSQRLKLQKNNQKWAHLLTMSATPIPRTIALTFYGDLDVSNLIHRPKGRQKITTWVVPNNKKADAYRWVKNKIKQKKLQGFIVCPTIEDEGGAKQQFEIVKKMLPMLRVDLLHGKLNPQEKDKVIKRFREHETDLLVTTSVIEVGVDIPKAAIMIIEGADNFGLAQLHQLRGRIGRGEQKSHCLLFSESDSVRSLKRLETVRKYHDGLTLAKLDLEMRGPGEVFGTKQHGLPELKFAYWQESELIKITRKVAEKIINNTEKYKDYLNSVAKQDK